jgi:two-component system, LuxR family, response regulator FixJ
MASEAVIHVVDDDDAIRDSMIFLLETAGYAARPYASAEAFLGVAEELAGGVLITDVRMPGMNGLELVHRLQDIAFQLPIIMITGHGDIPLAVEAMKAGVIDFIEKPFDDELLLKSIKAALAKADAGPGEDENTRALRLRFEALSPRERDVLQGVVAGKANKVIAYDLGISPRTVEVYRAGLMSKTGAGSVSELVRMALTLGVG